MAIINGLNVTYSESSKRFEVESETHQGHKYSVKYNVALGKWTCSCPWGKGRALKEGKDCKHVTAAMEYIRLYALGELKE